MASRAALGLQARLAAMADSLARSESAAAPEVVRMAAEHTTVVADSAVLEDLTFLAAVAVVADPTAWVPAVSLAPLVLMHRRIPVVADLVEQSTMLVAMAAAA